MNEKNKLVDAILDKIEPLEFENVLVSDYLVGQRYAVVQGRNMYVSPAIYNLMQDKEALNIMLGNLDVVCVSDHITVNQMYGIANKILGGEKMEVKTDIVVSGEIKLESADIPFRVTRTHGGQVNIINQEVNIGTKDRENWMSIYHPVVSEMIRADFFFALANRLLYDKIHGEKKKNG